MSAMETQRMGVRSRMNDVDQPAQLIHELFQRQVVRRPSAVALTYDHCSLTYSELNCRANQLARYLRELGVRPEERVAVCLERGPDTIVSLLGILKAGGAYVPLNPQYPSERLTFMCSDSSPVLLLTVDKLKGRIACNRTTVILLDAEWNTLDRRPSINLDAEEVGLDHRCAAYVIYTSGSTGTPKGVIVAHDSVTHFLAAANERVCFASDDVWTLFHSTAFDFSVLELWGALLSGSRVVIVPHDVTRIPSDFATLIRREGVTVLNQTPSALSQLLAAEESRAGLASLRTLIVGGETLQMSSLRTWYESHPSDSTHITNMYGPTETTVFVTSRQMEPADADRLGGSPIGKPLLYSEICILDTDFHRVPVGVTGEIFIGGAGVARGYLNRTELTAEKFVANPFTPERGARMYRSGDLGRWCPDGTVEYLGRNDTQVKIRGFRIELGEIEAYVAQQEYVKEVTVLARELTPGETHLVAYLTLQDSWRTETASCIAKLRAQLTSQLPEHMIPSTYIILESFPLTSNGKLDRQALPVPTFNDCGDGTFEGPRGEVERVLAQMWTEVLSIKRVGRTDNFFELGGRSLTGSKLVAKICARFSADLPASTLFKYPTIEKLAHFVESALQDGPLYKVPRHDDFEEGVV